MVTTAKPSPAPAAVFEAPVAAITIQLPPTWEINDDTFADLVSQNDHLRFEVDRLGRLIVTGSGGFASSARAAEIIAQMYNWIRAGAGGYVTAPDGFFRVTDVARHAPDAAWTSDERVAQIEDLERPPRICPDFIVEIRSPADRLDLLHEKMEMWIERGARLAWLVDPFERRLHVYQPNQPTEVVQHPQSLSCGDVLPGLTIDLTNIWRSD